MNNSLIFLSLKQFLASDKQVSTIIIQILLSLKILLTKFILSNLWQQSEYLSWSSQTHYCGVCSVPSDSDQASCHVILESSHRLSWSFSHRVWQTSSQLSNNCHSLLSLLLCKDVRLMLIHNAVLREQSCRCHVLEFTRTHLRYSIIHSCHANDCSVCFVELIDRLDSSCRRLRLQWYSGYPR